MLGIVHIRILDMEGEEGKKLGICKEIEEKKWDLRGFLREFHGFIYRKVRNFNDFFTS